MANLYAEETSINRTKGYRWGDSGVYETCHETRGALYRAMRKEHGRCVGKVHVECKGKTLDIGWVFLKLDRYEDTREKYLRETWVTVHAAPPKKTVEYQYAE